MSISKGDYVKITRQTPYYKTNYEGKVGRITRFITTRASRISSMSSKAPKVRLAKGEEKVFTTADLEKISKEQYLAKKL